MRIRTEEEVFMKQNLVIKGKHFGEGKPIVCVSAMGKNKEEVLANVCKLVELGAEMVEWRVDDFEKADSMNAVREVLEAVAPFVKDTVFVFTFRSKNQGGLMELSKDQIYDLHQVAAESKVVDFVDVEFFEAKMALLEIHKLQKTGVHVIASHHDFSQTPSLEVMMMLLERMGETGPDIVKLAVMPKDAEDVLTLLSATNQFHSTYPNQLLITMSMGGLGCISRIAGETFGSCVTFGAIGEVSAPGQLPMGQLSDMLTLIHNSI